MHSSLASRARSQTTTVRSRSRPNSIIAGHQDPRRGTVMATLAPTRGAVINRRQTRRRWKRVSPAAPLSSVGPLQRHQVRADDMPVLCGILVRNVVGEVPPIPNDDVLPDSPRVVCWGPALRKGPLTLPVAVISSANRAPLAPPARMASTRRASVGRSRPSSWMPKLEVSFSFGRRSAFLPRSSMRHSGAGLWPLTQLLLRCRTAPDPG